jgi:hypothetical protein
MKVGRAYGEGHLLVMLHPVLTWPLHRDAGVAHADLDMLLGSQRLDGSLDRIAGLLTCGLRYRLEVPRLDPVVRPLSYARATSCGSGRKVLIAGD